MTIKRNRAFLKWAGGKYRLVEQINKRLPDAEQLVEPFVGAGSVFLNTSYSHYVLNDINPDLINLYQGLQKKPTSFIADAKALFTAHNNHENQYYSLREEFNSTTDIYYRSILFLYLNRHGYNGLCRYSAKGRFNVPFGRYKRPYFPQQELEYFAEKAQQATFTCKPFQQIFDVVTQNSVIYCDPPYVPISTTASFTHYAKNGFGLESQQVLANLARETASNKKIPVLLSNHDLASTRALYQGAKFTSIKVNRSISQNGAKRKPVKEILALFPAS